MAQVILKELIFILGGIISIIKIIPIQTGKLFWIILGYTVNEGSNNMPELVFLSPPH